MTVTGPAGTVLSVVAGAAVNASLEVLGWVLPGDEYHGGPTVTLPATAPLGVAVTLFVRAKTALLFVLPPDFLSAFHVHGQIGSDQNNSPEITIEGHITPADTHRAALDLALDRSQFMDTTTIARTKVACCRLLDFMTDADWLGITWFTASVARKLTVQPLTLAHRAEALAAINTLKRTTSECSPFKVSTSIVNNLNELPETCVCAPDGRALFLISMGVESVPGYTPPPPSSTRRFGVALSSSPGVVPIVAPDHHFILGDTTDPNEMFRLEKFLLQSLAEVSELETIFDPVGSLSGQQVAKIPFEVADTDSNVRVVLLVDDPSLVWLDLEVGGKDVPVLEFPGASVRRGSCSIEFALDRTALDQNALGEEPCKAGLKDHRASLKDKQLVPPPAPSSTWRASISLSKTGLGLGGRLKPIPYTLLVFAESDLRFKAQVHVDSECVGGTAFMTAWLTEHGVRVTGKRVRIWAEVTYPDGGTGTIELHENVGGRFEAQLRCTQPGPYRYRIVAAGTTFRGKRFRRELTRTSHIRSGARHDCAPCPPHHGRPPSKFGGRGAELAEPDDRDHDEDEDVLDEPKASRLNDRGGQLGLALGKALEALRLARNALR
jgi:hypothetical protein